MAENRTDRELTTRDRTARRKSWARPELLPTPNPEPGYEFHWVRVSTMGQADPMNVSSKLREGWEPVKASDHPEIVTMGVENDRFKDNIVIGGLMLCKTPTEFVEDRNQYFQQQADAQMNAVDNNFMRENDPRMPLFRERSTKVTFGSGS
jgi:hypothetical protein